MKSFHCVSPYTLTRRSFPNVPTSDPREWRPFYNREQMENCLTKVQRISFRESIVSLSESPTKSDLNMRSKYKETICNGIIES